MNITRSLSMKTHNKKSSLFSVLALALVSIILSSTRVHAAIPAGTWKFERSMDYYRRTTSNQAPKFPLLIVRESQMRFSNACSVPFSADRYAFPRVFQPLSREGVTANQLDIFLGKAFGLTLAHVKTVYSLGVSQNNCGDPIMEFFEVGDHLLVPDGVTFHSYIKVGSSTATATPAGAAQQKVTGVYAGYKVTALPMDFDRYFSSCRPKIVGAKGRPMRTDKCAPRYFPYVADPTSSDTLMRIIGNHDYVKGGADYASGFSPPFQQKTFATFLVFPPMKQVTVVRVDDFEVIHHEERDTMSGVYLSIVNDKVVDQIDYCNLNADYVCVSEGRAVAKLSESGKFQKR